MLPSSVVHLNGAEPWLMLFLLWHLKKKKKKSAAEKGLQNAAPLFEVGLMETFFFFFFFKSQRVKLRPLHVLTCVSCQRRRRDDGFILAEVRALPHIVFESALGLVAVQGGGVVLRVEAVVRGYPLQAAEGGLAAPRLGQPVAALEALDALEGVLAAELTCEERMKR